MATLGRVFNQKLTWNPENQSLKTRNSHASIFGFEMYWMIMARGPDLVLLHSLLEKRKNLSRWMEDTEIDWSEPKKNIKLRNILIFLRFFTNFHLRNHRTPLQKKIEKPKKTLPPKNHQKSWHWIFLRKKIEVGTLYFLAPEVGFPPQKKMALENLYLEDHPSGCKWLGSAPFISHGVRPFGRGPTTPGLEDLRSPWLLTTY